MANKPKHKQLWQCTTPEEQTDWCEAKLLAGGTLTDPGIWLGGADPTSIIRKLRKKHKITTVRVEVTDAARIKHKVPGWKLTTPEPPKDP